MKSRQAFMLAIQFDEAIRAAGDDPDQNPELVVRDMIERMLHWCDIHKIPFDTELGAGRELHREREE